DQRRRDVAGEKHVVVQRAPRDRDTAPTHLHLDAVDGSRVGALVESELGEKARPERAALLHAPWRRPSRVVLLARAAANFDNVNAPLDPPRYPLVLHGAVAFADRPN